MKVKLALLLIPWLALHLVAQSGECECYEDAGKAGSAVISTFL